MADGENIVRMDDVCRIPYIHIRDVLKMGINFR